MGELVARDSKVNRPFKPQIYEIKRRGQSRNFYDSHNCDSEYEQNYRRVNFRGNMTSYQDFGRMNNRAYRGDYMDENYGRDRGRSRSRERSFSRNDNTNRRNDRGISNTRSRSGSRVCTNQDRIRCYKCRE